MINVTLTLTGVEKATSQLSTFKAKLKDLSRPLQEAGEFMMDFFGRDVFQSEGGAIGNPWAPLTEPYQTEKLKRWGPTTILIASGKMAQSYSLKVASDYLIISNDAVNRDGNYYARYHQDGTSKMLARPIMKFQDQQLKHVADIIVSYINSIHP